MNIKYDLEINFHTHSGSSQEYLLALMLINESSFLGHVMHSVGNPVIGLMIQIK